MANEFIKLGFKLGIGGVLTFKNSKLHEVIEKIDLKNILLETDSPYLSPEPNRGKQNIPSNVFYVAKKISENHVDASGKNNPNYGKKHSEANRLKMSEIKNSCGYYRVYKNKDKNCKQGYIYTYQYYDEDNKRRSISSIDIKKLENKVKKKGLKWIKFK